MRFGDAYQLVLAEREKRARIQGRSLEQLAAAKAQARSGNVRPYVRLQWPTVRLEEWQWDILDHLFDATTWGVWVKGNTGCGKGASAGIGVCAYFDVFDDAKVVITRDTADTAVKIAFGEVEKWWNRMAYKPAGAMLTQGIVENKNHNVSVANPQQPEGFVGSHSQHVLFWFDEATAGNLEDKFKLARTQAKKFLALGNPRTLAGNFRDAFPKSKPDETQTILGRDGRRHRCITVSGWDCTNVKAKCLAQPVSPIGGIEIDGEKFAHGEPIPPERFEKCHEIIPGQTCYDEFQSLLNDPDPFVREVFALARFPKSDPVKQVVRPEWLDPCCERWNRWQAAGRRAVPKHFTVKPLLSKIIPVEAFGLDVAASSFGDKTVLVPGGRRGIRSISECQFADTQQTVAWVIETALHVYGVDLKRGEHPVGIDWSGGFGNAVGDPLRRLGVCVIEVYGSKPSEIDPQRYANTRAEMYGEFGARIDPQGQFKELPFFIPDDSELREELVAPQKIFDGKDGQKFFITPKSRRGRAENFKGQTLKEMLGRSPDKADAAVYMLYALRFKGMSIRSALDAGFF